MDPLNRSMSSEAQNFESTNHFRSGEAYPETHGVFIPVDSIPH